MTPLCLDTHFRIEGRWNVEAALDSGFPVEQVFLVGGQHADLRERLEDRCPVMTVSPEEAEALAGYPFHRGVFALAPRPVPRRLVEIEPRFPLVVCPALGDASNLGAIIRSAAALGAGMIAVAHGRGADPYSPKAVRAASGALFRIPVVASPALLEDVAGLAARGARVIGAAGENGAIDVRSSPRGERMIFVFGSEARGLDSQWRSLCQALVAIPMRAEVESLNVGAAAAIILWEVLRESPE